MNPSRIISAAATLAAALLVSSSFAIAAPGATKDEPVAMVKKAVAFIETEGPAAIYSAISDPQGRFVDRDLYIVVYGLDGMVLAHGANAKRIGTNQIGDKDPDGKEFVKERVDLAAKQPSICRAINS